MTAGLERYTVNRAAGPLPSEARWEAPEWDAAPALRLTRWMGDRPAHFPTVQAKILYDDSSLHVIFRVQDRYVRAVVTDYQGAVCTDSCAELFITPEPAVDHGYFNIEVNCGGTMLFTHRLARDEETVPVSKTHAQALAVAATMPRRVEPELTEPTVWCVRYRLPYAVLEQYAPLTRPAPGVIWRANLYKCGDLTSHPHWLTWAEVKWEKPDFHRKEFFGELVFHE
jgi:hypothetical protein